MVQVYDFQWFPDTSTPLNAKDWGQYSSGWVSIRFSVHYNQNNAETCTIRYIREDHPQTKDVVFKRRIGTSANQNNKQWEYLEAHAPIIEKDVRRVTVENGHPLYGKRGKFADFKQCPIFTDYARQRGLEGWEIVSDTNYTVTFKRQIKP